MKYTTPVFKKDVPDDNHKFKTLPTPTGKYPYRVSLQKFINDPNPEKLVINFVGDTGSIRNLDFQEVVVGEMLKQFSADKEEQPDFLYHLGDVVYNFGEADAYYAQFFEHYYKYPRPIFAIAGNHDSDVNPNATISYNSLDAFMEVFCAPQSSVIPFSHSAKKMSGTQPNVYWTLETPLATIIGLYSNVPKFGIITTEQLEWFKGELLHAQTMKPQKAIIVCIHHAPYSADINHGSSRPMIQALEEAFSTTGVKPDIVFSGHVHNYQRLHKTYSDGTIVPFIVAGAGGYDVLHAVAHIDDERFTNDDPLLQNAHLINYCEDRHGFLKLTLERSTNGVIINGAYFSIPHAKEDERVNHLCTDTFRYAVTG